VPLSLQDELPFRTLDAPPSLGAFEERLRRFDSMVEHLNRVVVAGFDDRSRPVQPTIELALGLSYAAHQLSDGTAKSVGDMLERGHLGICVASLEAEDGILREPRYTSEGLLRESTSRAALPNTPADLTPSKI
jgi:hypothetical protein